MDGISWVLGGSAAVDAVVMTLVIGWIAHRGAVDGVLRPFGVRSCIAAAAVAGAISVAKMVLLWVVGVRVFGMMRVCYLFGAVVVPLAGLIVLVGRYRGLPGFSRLPATGGAVALSIVAVCAAPLAGYASLVEPFRLQLERETVTTPKMPAEARPVTVAVLADLQFDRVTDYERRAVRMAMAARPHLIVLPGDLFQGSDAQFERELSAIRELLGSLDAPGGIYLVEGNVDLPGRLPRAVAGTGVEYLRDEVAYTSVGEVQMAIGGLTWTPSSRQRTAVVDELREADGRGVVTILLAHAPDEVLRLDSSDSGVDLVIAGHTHGGQVQIPGIGPLITFSRVPNRVAGGGLHECSGNQIYVSRGVGWERGHAPRVRFWCRPEVSVLTIKGSTE
jgi:predicted MPP superfamily phosphohydrolase